MTNDESGRRVNGAMGEPMQIEERILLSLGRMEGKLDAALNRIDGHDADIDELRHQHGEVTAHIGQVEQSVTKIRAYLFAAWAAIGLLVSMVGVIAGLVGLFR